MYSCPKVLPEKSGKGHTCKNFLYVMCQQSSKMNHVHPLPITKFLTCEISNLVPRLLKMVMRLPDFLHVDLEI